jgi:hypothetical protein
MLLNENLISNIDNKRVFSANDMYTFYIDREDIADNLVKNWKH